jgi:hypothetical protein
MFSKFQRTDGHMFREFKEFVVYFFGGNQKSGSRYHQSQRFLQFGHQLSDRGFFGFPAGSRRKPVAVQSGACDTERLSLLPVGDTAQSDAVPSVQIRA